MGQCLQRVPEHSQPAGRAGDGRGRVAGRSSDSLRAAGWRPRIHLSRKGGVSLKLVNPASDLVQHSRMGFIILLTAALIIAADVTTAPVYCVSLWTRLEVLRYTP